MVENEYREERGRNLKCLGKLVGLVPNEHTLANWKEPGLLMSFTWYSPSHTTTYEALVSHCQGKQRITCRWLYGDGEIKRSSLCNSPDREVGWTVERFISIKLVKYCSCIDWLYIVNLMFSEHTDTHTHTQRVLGSRGQFCDNLLSMWQLNIPKLAVSCLQLDSKWLNSLECRDGVCVCVCKERNSHSCDNEVAQLNSRVFF